MAGVLGGCVWVRFVVLSLFCRRVVVFVVGLWCRPAFGACVFSCAFPLPPTVFGSGVRCGCACWARFSAVPRPSWLRCRGVFFALFFFFFSRLLGLSVPGLVVSPPVSFLSGWAAGLFFFVCLFRCPFSRWAAVPGFVLPVLAGWSPCACLGVLSWVPSGSGVWPPSVSLAGGLLAVGCFPDPRAPPPLFLGGGGGGGLAAPPFAFPRLALALWLVCGVVGPWPLLAEVPVCYSPPLMAGFRCRWWWAVPATPGWGPLAAVVCGVWWVAVACWWGCGWCVVWLVPRHSWRWFVCATPRHSWLGFAAGGGGRSPPFLAGVRWRRCCVVCGVWRWCVGGVVAGVWCGWSLATPGGGSLVLLPATPGWVLLPLVVGGPRHSWLGSVGGGGVWCVVCGGGVLVELWLVCGVVGPSPLLAEVPVCFSPPLLAGFRCRWCSAVPATPGWGPLAAVVRGVWCVGVWRRCGVGVVAGVWCGWSLATPCGGSCVLVPATPNWVSLPLVVGGPRHSWLGSAGGGGVWCVVCGVWRWCGVGVVVGVWCGWSLATPGEGPCVLLPATPGWVSLPVVVGGPRHSWLGSVGGGGVGCVVCCVLVGSLATPGGGSCVLLLATPGWVSLLVVVGGPRHSWLGSAGGGGVWCVVCGGGVLVGLWLGAHPSIRTAAGVRVCSCACFAWPGRAGRPPGRVLVRLTFSFGRFVLLLCLAPSGLGLPLSLSLLLPVPVGCFSRPPAAWLSVRSRLVYVSRLAVGCSLVVAPPPPSPFVSRGFRRSCLVPRWFFFFFSLFFFLCAPPLSPALSGFRPRVPWASALALFALLAFRFSALRALVPLSCFLLGCWLLPGGCCPPPPFLVLRFSSLLLGALVFFFFG